MGGRPAFTLHAPPQLVYSEWLRDVEGCCTPLCLLRQLGFACGQNRGDVRLTGGRVGPLCCSTSLKTYSQHETTKDAPQSMARDHNLRSSSSSWRWGAVASQRLPLCAVARSGSDIYCTTARARESSCCSPVRGAHPACMSQGAVRGISKRVEGHVARRRYSVAKGRLTEHGCIEGIKG